jgi:short-subunit dehydrogenase
VDLAEPDAPRHLVAATDDIEIGLIVSNAGNLVLGSFLDDSHAELVGELRLNTEAHLSLTHRFGRPMAARGRGGVLLVSSTAALQPMAYSANYAATKAYMMLLGEGVHRELAPRGVHVSVLLPGATDTPLLRRFAGEVPSVMKLAQTPQECVTEGLTALRGNKAIRVSGRVNRLTNAMTTRGLRARLFTGLNKSMADKAATRTAPVTETI